MQEEHKGRSDAGRAAGDYDVAIKHRRASLPSGRRSSGAGKLGDPGQGALDANVLRPP